MPGMRVFALLLLALASAGCSPKAAEPWAGPKPAAGPTEDVAIPSLGITLQVPAGTDVVHVGAGATFYVNPGARAARAFSLEDGEPALVHGEPAVARHEKKLPGGSRIRYELRVSTGASGGPEAFLDGALVVGQQVLAVHCHDQAEEPATPSAEWCLEWLATVRRES